MNDSKLTYFTRSEFDRDGKNWFDDMCPSLLVRLDVLRNMWGAPIRISLNDEAIGRDREPKEGYNDFHNIRKWGEVRAIDVFFDRPDDKEYWDDWAITEEIDYYAGIIGFSGIGIYPTVEYKGKRRTMFHLDTGNRKATWSRVNGKYLDFESGIKWLEENG